MRWFPKLRPVVLMLILTMSGCGLGREQTISPTAPSAVPSLVFPSTPIPFSTPIEGKPTPPPGSETPWTPPPTPTLPSSQTSWQVHEFPEIGVRMRVPSDWNVLRNPGYYLITANGDYRMTVSFCCEELPRALPEFQKAIVPYWHTLHAQDFLVMPLQGSGWQGIGVWRLPNTCLAVYIPSPEIVRQITFFPIFCEPDRERLLPLGQQMLDSVEIFSPRGGWEGYGVNTP